MCEKEVDIMSMKNLTYEQVNLILELSNISELLCRIEVECKESAVFRQIIEESKIFPCISKEDMKL
jgi:hypothetical protein